MLLFHPQFSWLIVMLTHWNLVLNDLSQSIIHLENHTVTVVSACFVRIYIIYTFDPTSMVFFASCRFWPWGSIGTCWRWQAFLCCRSSASLMSVCWLPAGSRFALHPPSDEHRSHWLAGIKQNDLIYYLLFSMTSDNIVYYAGVKMCRVGLEHKHSCSMSTLC